MGSNVYFLKERINDLLVSLSKGIFTESQKLELSKYLDELELLRVDREVLQSTRIGSTLTKLSKSLDFICQDSSRRVLFIIEKWKSQLRSVNSTSIDSSNPFKKHKTLDSPDYRVNDISTEATPNSDGNGFSSPTNLNSNLSTLSKKFSKSTPDLTRFEDESLGSQELTSSGLGLVSFNRNMSSSCLGDLSREDDDLDLPSYSGKFHNDLVRDKALRYLFRCFLLGQDFGPEIGKLNELVFEIENSLHNYFVSEKGSQKQYNLQLKCIAFNLKDIKNTLFNYKVYNGMIPVSDLVTMSSLQMASDEKKLERNEILEQSLEACQSDWAIKNIFMTKKNSGQFKCGKCNSRQTTYYQLQTRSSDEPMTTFVTCINCKNRWRF